MTAGPATSVSIYDVARQAGVSHQTVSRVVNGRPGVAPDTRQRVERATRELGWCVNRAARNLRTARSGDHGVVVVGDPGAREWTLVAGIHRAARRDGGAVVVEFAATPLGTEAAARALWAHRVDVVWVVENGSAVRSGP